jgi:hypothetical protein
MGVKFRRQSLHLIEDQYHPAMAGLSRAAKYGMLFPEEDSRWQGCLQIIESNVV